MSNLISTSALAAKLHDPNIVILDASWHLPTAKRDAKAEFLAKRIPGARFFDLDAASDQTSPLPHMLPTPEHFSAVIGTLGIDNNAHVVAYDSVGLFSAARCWWMFKTFGHDKVSVLDGGLKKWLAENRATDSGEASPIPSKSFRARLIPNRVVDLNHVATTKAQIADARSPARFRGEEPEPRSGVKPGHIPGAHSVHYATMLKNDGTLKNHEALEATFRAAGIDPAKPVITSCGSGVTAAILSLALTELGQNNHQLYDGSWTEWGASSKDIQCSC